MEADETLALGFGRSTFRFAAEPGEISDVAHLAGRRIATSYQRVVADHLRAADAPAATAVDVLLRRLQGVLVARRYVLMDYDVPVALADAAGAVTPGLESPTISPLADPSWVAVRAMVPRGSTNRIMGELYDLGARAILVTDIHACRL
ncbi:MAG: ATP phosphoribosyltransferase [Mycobacteriales bacterium]